MELLEWRGSCIHNLTTYEEYKKWGETFGITFNHHCQIMYEYEQNEIEIGLTEEEKLQKNMIEDQWYTWLLEDLDDLEHQLF